LIKGARIGVSLRASLLLMTLEHRDIVHGAIDNALHTTGTPIPASDSAGSNYRTLHEIAIREADKAGRAGTDIGMGACPGSRGTALPHWTLSLPVSYERPRPRYAITGVASTRCSGTICATKSLSTPRLKLRAERRSQITGLYGDPGQCGGDGAHAFRRNPGRSSRQPLSQR
jgi:hypothetical protein